MDPLVTVVIPCHNHAKWVKGAIESVVYQDYANEQIVVVDDGSTDGSLREIVGCLSNCYSMPAGPEGTARYLGDILDTKIIVLCYLKASGPSFARNRGIEAAWKETDAFMFLDSDDEYLQGKISKSVAVWNTAAEQIGGVYSDFETVNEATGVAIRQYKEPFSRKRLIQECIANMDSFVSKRAFQECGLFDETLRVCEDYDLWLKISERFVLMHIPEPLVRIRVGDHSSTSGVAAEKWKADYQKVFDNARKRASQ